MNDDRLTAFRDALREGDTAAAVERFDAFDDAIDAQATRESSLRTVARELITIVPPTQPAHKAAQQFIDRVATAEQARLEAKYSFGLHVENGPDAASVADSVDSVIQTTESVNEASEAVQTEARAIGGDFQPAYAVFGPTDRIVPLGSDVSVSYTVENVGAVAVDAKPVELDGYDLSVTPASTPELAPDETTTVTASGTADERAEAPLTLQVGSKVARTSFNVLAKRDFLDNALTVLGTIRDRLDRIGERSDDDGGNGNGNGGGNGNGNGNGGGNGNGNGGQPGLQGLINKVETATTRIEKIIERLSSGKGRRADKRIGAVANLLGAFVNQVEGLSKQQLSSEDTAVLAGDAGRVIDRLETAIEADAA